MSIATIGYVPVLTFAQKLRITREGYDDKRVTQAEFAELLGVTKNAYAQWEAGNNQPRDIVEMCKKIQRITGVSSAWLLGVVNPEPDPGEQMPKGRIRRNESGPAVAGTGFEPVTSGLLHARRLGIREPGRRAA